MIAGKKYLKTVKAHSWRPEAQSEVLRLIAAGWRLVEVITEENNSRQGSSGQNPPTIYFKLERIS